MPLQDSVAELGVALRHLHDAIEALRLVVSDRPAAPPSALVEQFEVEVDDLRAWFAEAFAAYDELRRSDGPRTTVLLRRATENIHRIGAALACELETADRLGDLMDLGLTRNDGWRAWSLSVRGCLTAARRPAWEAVQAGLLCWQAAAERVVVTAAAG